MPLSFITNLTTLFHGRSMHKQNNVANKRNEKFFPSCKAHRVMMISISLALRQFPLWDHGYEMSSSYSVPVYAPAFAGTHCA